MAGGTTLCETIPPLTGWRVGVTAHRRADEQAALLRRRGAEVVLGPVVRTLPFGDDGPLREATESVLARPPDLLVATTGIGIRSWFGAAESWAIDRELRDALARARIVSRGPKARAALAAAGLASQFEEPSERLDRLVDVLVATGVRGARIALQLYGDEASWAVDRLRAAGADVVPVPVYRWTRPDDGARAQHLVEEVLTGQLDAVTFTSAAAVRSFAALAEEIGAGAAADLRLALSSSTLAACVGPITAEAAAAAGFDRRCSPGRGRLGLMVRVLSADLHARHRHLSVGDRHLVVHGASVWTSPDGHVVLTGLAGRLLGVLAERPGVVVSRQAFRQRVWRGRGGDSAMDTGLSRLRRALRPVGLGVRVLPRRGWALEAAEAPCPAAPLTGDTAVTGLTGPTGLTGLGVGARAG
jgi:uroporphyrinogen-III synthase